MSYLTRTHALVTSIQIYDESKGQSPEKMTRYECSLLLTDLGLNECRLHFIQGKLNNEINLQIMDICREMGYVQVQFEVPSGTKATRYSEFQYSLGGLDRYIIKL